MSTDKPVVVCGASGYTGQLICEYLREFKQPPKRAGFASSCQAFGHRELLGVLRSFGLVMEPVLTTAH
jgi:short subunit dehydrogenase-like uncharacterized protein